METTQSSPDKTIAALIHLSVFSKYFIPLGNFLFPLILWTAKQKDPFVDAHGRQALNFQISIFLYFILLLSLGVSGIVFMGFKTGLADTFLIKDHISSFSEITGALPVIIYALVIGLLLLALFILEIFAVITATMRANEGSLYKYPLSINFITPTPVGKNQSKNEQFNNTQNQTL